MLDFLKKINKKYFLRLGYGVLFLGFLATRLWRITTIPNGLHVDEASIAYDAWCLANYGVDRHLISWPVYLINFGGGQNILYCYLCVALFKLFGFSVWLLRLPAVFFSFLTLVFGMLLVKKNFPDNPVFTLTAGCLIVICPYFIMASRFGLESNLMLGASTVFLYCFTCAIESEKYRWYVLAGIAGGITLYTYAISYLVLPIFLLFTLIYVIWVRRFSFLRWVSMAIPMGILAFPLILEQYINAFDKDEIRLGIFTVTKLLAYRGSEIGFFSWDNFCEALSKIFLGDRNWILYNSIPGIPNLYYVTIPLVLCGGCNALFILGKSLKRRELSLSSYPLFWFLIMLPISGSVLQPNVNKANSIFFSMVFLAVEGLHLLITVKKQWRHIIAALAGGVYFVCFIRFSTYYYLGGYTADYRTMALFDVMIPEAVSFLEEHPQYKNKGTYMSEDAVYFAISSLMSPYDLRFDESTVDLCGYYHCELPDIPEDGYNYILRDFNIEYSQQLRDRGYTEIRYVDYSLFYQEDYQE